MALNFSRAAPPGFRKFGKFDAYAIHTRSPYEEALIIQRELDYNVDEQLAIVVQYVPSLNADQLSVFTTIMTAVNDHEQYRIYLIAFLLICGHICSTCEVNKLTDFHTSTMKFRQLMARIYLFLRGRHFF